MNILGTADTPSKDRKTEKRSHLSFFAGVLWDGV